MESEVRMIGNALGELVSAATAVAFALRARGQAEDADVCELLEDVTERARLRLAEGDDPMRDRQGRLL